MSRSKYRTDPYPHGTYSAVKYDKCVCAECEPIRRLMYDKRNSSRNDRYIPRPRPLTAQRIIEQTSKPNRISYQCNGDAAPAIETPTLEEYRRIRAEIRHILIMAPRAVAF